MLYCLVGLCLVAAAPLLGQQLLHRRYDRAAGMPSDYVFDVRQDRRGYMWFATDQGVVRYDGQNFRTWSTDQGLSSAMVYRLAEDTAGGVWAATFEGGLSRIAPNGAVEVYGPMQLQRCSSVNQVEVAASGEVYALGNEGLSVRTQQRWVLDTTGNRSLGAAIGRSPDGQVLLARGGGLWRLSCVGASVRRVRVRVVDPQRLLPNQHDTLRVISLLEPGPATLWVTTSAGLLELRLEGAVATVLSRRSITGPNGCIARAPEGWLAMGNSSQGLMLELSSGLRRFTTAQGLPVNYINQLYFDREGSLWVATFGGGVLRVLAPQALWLTTAEGLPDSYVTALSVDRQSHVWVGTPQGYATYDPSGQLVQQGRLNGARPEDRQVRAFAHDYSSGALPQHYVASFTTLYRVQGAERRVAFYEMGKSEDGFADLAWGPDGHLWTASYGSGLQRLDLRRPLLGLQPAPVPTSSLMLESLYPGSNGSLWVVTGSNGVDWTDGLAVHHLGRSEGLPTHRITALYEDAAGDQWFGSDHGLSRRGRGGWHHWGRAEGLVGQRVLCVFEYHPRDQPPLLMAVSDAALHRLNGDSLVALPAFTLRPDERTSINRVRYDRLNRRLLIGTTRGLIIRDLDVVPNTPSPLPVVLQGVEADGVSYSPAELTGVPLELEAGVGALTIRYAGLSYLREDAVSYRTRLNGLDADWSAPTPAREVIYRNLSEGRFSLEVEFTVPDGRRIVTSDVVTIRVRPPWYKRWYVVTPALLLSVLAFVALGRYLAQRRLMRRIRALETEQRLQAERERISRDLHDHVGAQLTSLVSGLDLGERLDHTERDRLLQLLRNLKNDARATIGQLRETIWALHQQSVSLAGFAQRVETYAGQLLAGRVRPRFEVQLPQGEHAEARLSPTEALQLFRIAQEAIQNAFKHAKADTIRLVLAHEGGELSLEVIDDGIGMNGQAENGHVGAEHYGLLNMRRRAEELGGRCRIGPGPARGTAVAIRIPWRPHRMSA